MILYYYCYHEPLQRNPVRASYINEKKERNYQGTWHGMAWLGFGSEEHDNDQYKDVPLYIPFLKTKHVCMNIRSHQCTVLHCMYCVPDRQIDIRDTRRREG